MLVRSSARAGALAVARDIRASTGRRLARVDALPKPAGEPEPLTRRWIALERRLAGVYASTYVRIFDAVAAANTLEQRAREPRVLHRLLGAPDELRAAAGRLEQRLGIPDCTGGG